MTQPRTKTTASTAPRPPPKQARRKPAQTKAPGKKGRLSATRKAPSRKENIQTGGLLNSLLDSIPDIVFFKDIKGVYLGCNPAFAEFTGLAQADIPGKSDYDLFDKEIADFFRIHDQKMLDLKEPLRNEEWITYPDGRKKLIDTLKTPYWGQNGKLIGILGISRDITERKQAGDALRESETNFRTFFKTIDDLIVVATPEGRIIFANHAIEHTLGYSADELITMHVLDLHAPSDRQEAGDIFAAMIRGELESCPLPLITKNGALLPVETRVWFGKWNGSDCLFGVSKNLSREQEAKQRFERLFRSNPNPMALTSIPERQFVDVNAAFLEALGYSWDEIIGKTSTALNLFVAPEQQTLVAERLQKDHNILDFELQVRRKDGTVLDGLFSGEVISNQGKSYILSVMSNITERKRIARELARLSAIQRELTNLATNFINLPLEKQDDAINQSLATMGQLIHVNRSYLFAYDFDRGVMSNTHEWCEAGITPEIHNLQNIPVALFPDWMETHKRGNLMHIPDVANLPPASPLRQILEPQGVRSLITLPLMQGTTCLGFVGFDAVREARNWAEDEVSLLRVLAELYAHFEARRAVERETRELQKSLILARDAAQEAARAKSMFMANMSHEIRTPLNVILGYAQIMERECRVCPTGQRLNAITRSGEHLLELITDLMELVRNDSHVTVLSPSDFDFYEVLNDVRLMFARRAEAQGLTLDIDHTPDVPQFLCTDQGKVRQILVNLIGNALKFTGKGGVRLSARNLHQNASDEILLSVDVEDTGCGIREDEMGAIFNAFEQTEYGRKTGKGTGLGLPLSRLYAQALGGNVTVTSQPGEGSCFHFTFHARPAKTVSGQLRQNVVLRLKPNQRPCHILTVDDDVSNRDMLAIMLKAVGFNVETADNAFQTLHRLRQPGKIDLLLMDKQMPEMDGFEAIRRIRDLPGGLGIPVLVVTAAGFTEQREQALAAGANGHVSKPVRREQLLEEIARVVGVQYEYEQPPPAGPSTSPLPDLSPDELARLPAETSRSLAQALRRGDIHLLRQLVDTLSHDQPGLAAGLRSLVDAYDYNRLHRLLAAAKGESV